MPSKEEKLLADSLSRRKCLIKLLDALERFIRDYDHARDSCQLCVRVESLDKLNEDYAECQSVIERLDEEEELDEHIDERVEFEQRFCRAKGFLLSKRVADANQSALNNSMQAAQHHQPHFHLRLPKIEMPKFNGDFSRWISFRDTFTSMVHVNGDIPAVAKLQYLLQSLEGSAKKPFESVDIEADNYATTWDALLKRYDNRKYLKKQLFRALYDLPAVKQECATRIHGLVDDYQRHVRALSKLGEPVDHWDLPLILMLSYKLDQATLRAWEEKTSQKDDVKYDELVEFLYQRVRILQSVGPETHHSASSKVAGNPQKSFKEKVSANAATASPPSYSCPLSCSDSHSLRTCPVFLGKSVSQRRELVSQKRLCWNCLSFGHQSKKCGSKFSCRTCREKHHSLLHDSAPVQASATPAIQTSSAEPTVSSQPAAPAAPLVHQPRPSTSNSVDASGSRQVSMAVQTACTMTLLETVVLNIVDDHGQTHKARALLDSASMSNFISKPLAKNLYSRRSPVDVSVAGIGSSTQKISSAITATIESGDRTISMKLQFLVLKQPSSDLPTMPIDISAWKLPNVQLADPQFNVPGSVDLVIGSETYWELHTGRKISLGEGLPWVVETPFGWAVTGPASRSATCIPRLCYLSTADDRLEVALRKLWDMETTPSNPVRSSEENRLEELYTVTTTRDTTGRYIVRLPRTEERRWASNAQEVLQDVSPEDLNVQPLHEQPSNHLKITPPVFVWSDSSTVLQWLRASPTRWKTFVANRVSKIQNTTCIDHWRHIAGFENPADDFSRELNPADILNSSRRCQGPSWLTLVPDCWPKIIIDGANSPTVSEEGRKTPVVAMTTAQTTFCGDVRSRYSRYNKLRREAAFRSRYRHRLKERAQLHRSRSNIAELSVSNQRKPPPVPPLTTAELQHAEHPFRMTHHAGFSDLGNDDRIAKSSALKLLKPFIDEGGTLRIGARLRNTAPSTAYKHPIVLFAEHPLSALLASSLHPTLVQQSTADLPVSRVSPLRLFIVCGVDCHGSLYEKTVGRNRGPTEVYVAIFICCNPPVVIEVGAYVNIKEDNVPLES
nr:uncharacterized protein LOC109415800 [Aedes albopictus]